jgi:hypothetical protein
VVGTIEIGLADHVGDLVPRGIVEQQAADYRLLRLNRVGRQLDEFNLGVGDTDALRYKLCQIGTLVWTALIIRRILFRAAGEAPADNL